MLTSNESNAKTKPAAGADGEARAELAEVVGLHNREPPDKPPLVVAVHIRRFFLTAQLPVALAPFGRDYSLLLSIQSDNAAANNCNVH